MFKSRPRYTIRDSQGKQIQVDLRRDKRLKKTSRWERLPEVFAGDQPWNSKVLCDPTVEVRGDTVAVWFGGGDVASPDENLHGQIGFGVLHATLTK